MALKANLAPLLDKIPFEGIGETELAIQLGIPKITDLRVRLNQLMRQGEIEQCEDNPAQYRRRAKKEVTESQIWEVIPENGAIHAVEVAMSLDTTVPAVTEILKRLQNQGKLTQNGEEWCRNEASALYKTGTTVDNRKTPIPDNQIPETRKDGDGETLPEGISGRDSIVPIVGVSSSPVLSKTNELTYDEMNDRLRLERKIERGFYEAGKALLEIRERRLYRDKWPSFESYVLDRLGFKRRYANYQIAAAEIVDELALSISTEIEQGTNSSLSGTRTVTLPLPTAETQVRPLSSLLPDDRPKAWEQAVKQASGRVPSEQIVKAVVREFEIRNLCKSPNPYKVGAIVIAKKKKGWWVVREIGEFCCTCYNAIDQIEEIHHFDLKEIEYPKEQRKFMDELQEHLCTIWKTSEKLTSITNAVMIQEIVRAIAHNSSGFLTDFQKKLLETIENEVGGEF